MTRHDGVNLFWLTIIAVLTLIASVITVGVIRTVIEVVTP